MPLNPPSTTAPSQLSFSLPLSLPLHRTLATTQAMIRAAGLLAAPAQMTNAPLPRQAHPPAEAPATQRSDTPPGFVRVPPATQRPTTPPGYVRVLPGTQEWLQRHVAAHHLLDTRLLPLQGDGARPPALAPAAPTAAGAVSEQEQRTFEALSHELCFAWRQFKQALIAHASSQGGTATRIRQLANDTHPSHLAAQQPFARYLHTPEAMLPLRTALMNWLKAHVNALERMDIDQHGSSSITAARKPYLSGMGTLLSLSYTTTAGHPTLAPLLDVLHEEDVAMRRFESTHVHSWPQWSEWINQANAPAMSTHPT